MHVLLQEMLMFAGLGHCAIEVNVDSSEVQAFFTSSRDRTLEAQTPGCCGSRT